MPAQVPNTGRDTLQCHYGTGSCFLCDARLFGGCHVHNYTALERRNVFKLFDLKSITGKSIVGSRLLESVGQANRVLLNMSTDYNPSALARAIKMYFERSEDAREVLIFRGKRIVSVTRDITLSNEYYNIFMKRYLR